MDDRDIQYGDHIPQENYCDQPYVVTRKDGAWVVCLTTGSGVEGATEQHVISAISLDRGKSWSAPVDIEPKGPPESSWVMPYITEYGRIYAFYVYNEKNMRSVLMDCPEGAVSRVDTLGAMMYRYSDDGGESWSKERYRIPIRNFEIDRHNPYGGKIQFFWGVGKPIRHKGALYLGFAKVGRFGEGFMERDEGAFLRCGNIETEHDPEKLLWETLPEEEYGIRSPKGKIADEHNLVSLSCGDLFCSFRTVTGHNGMAYSRDDGRTWSAGEYARYAPGGRLMKHPRAANFVRKYSNGKYTWWFHNHGKDLTADPSAAYLGRNPAWLCGGVEKDGYIYWSQPEVVLYSREEGERISYPDFIEAGEDVYITETQKTVARVHRVNREILDAVWNHTENRTLNEKGLLWEFSAPGGIDGELPRRDISAGDSFTLQFLLDMKKAVPGLLAEGRDSAGQGVWAELTPERTVRLSLSDGKRVNVWESDTVSEDRAHVTAIVDAGAGIISFVVNGEFCDGGETRDYGFGRLDRNLGEISGKGVLTFPGNGVLRVRLWDRYLLTNEAVAAWRYDTDRGSL